MNSAAEPSDDAVPAPEPSKVASSTHDIVAIGASTGGLSALQTLLGALPADFAAAVFIVRHIGSDVRSALPAILARAGPLPVRQAEDGMAVRPGCVLVAPPDGHLLVEPGRVAVTHGPRENRHRPAIDPLFRSAAWAYGPRVVGVVLSGGLDDGTAGLWAIKSCGGTTIVQEPAEAVDPDMPSSALMHNRIDHRLRLTDIAALLVRLSREPVPDGRRGAPATLAAEVAFAKGEGDPRAMNRLGALSPFTCPSCRGALWEMDEAGHLRYRCHTGHAFTHEALSGAQDVAMEHAVYTALCTVEEKAMALRRLAERWPDTRSGLRKEYERRARELDATGELLRRLLASGSQATLRQ